MIMTKGLKIKYRCSRVGQICCRYITHDKTEEYFFISNLLFITKQKDQRIHIYTHLQTINQNTFIDGCSSHMNTKHFKTKTEKHEYL